MAQTNTGLGWSADSGYLVSTGNYNLGSIGQESSALMPQIPVATSTEALLANGLKIASGNGYGQYIGCDPGVVAFIGCTESRKFECYSKTQNAVIYTQFIYDDGTPYLPQQNLTLSLVAGSGYYYASYSGAAPLISNVYGIHTRADFVASITTTGSSFYKLNSGYAVACFVHWKKVISQGVAGTYWTPILISTDRNAVNISLNNVDPAASMAVHTVQYDGLRFYMSYLIGVSGVPDTILNEIDVSSVLASENDIFRGISGPSYANIVVLETVDPYEDFGNTEEDAGEIDPEPDDDEIEEDDLPTTSFADAGFCRIYRPSLAQINALSNYMWTDQTFLQTVINHLKQIIENPIDSIISLSLVPCVPNAGGDVEVKVMYIPTGVYMPPVTNQFVEVDCGTVALKEMYGSALDYNPYTSVQLYLPYVGIVQLDTDEVMGKTIHVGYRIDVVTGVCCAYVKAGADVLYQFSGHCSIQQPITSADFSGYVNAALAAGKLVASIAAAGAGAPEVAATLAGAPAPSVSATSSETRTTERNEATGRQITAGTKRKETRTENPGASFGEIATRGVSNTVGAVMNSKTIVQHSGGFSGNSGYLAAVRRPYLIVTRPRIANPEKYGQFNGRPSMIYMNLGSCTGFTQVQSIQLTGINATNPELSEITTLLTSGVIF